jgi:hypothetical protein
LNHLKKIVVTPVPKYKLSKEKHEKIFKDLEKEMLSVTTRVDNPRIVVGGQPGAGKGKLGAVRHRRIRMLSNRKLDDALGLALKTYGEAMACRWKVDNHGKGALS